MKAGEDLHLDPEREERVGHPEIIYAEGKSVDQLRRVVAALAGRGMPVFLSRLRPEQASELEGLDHDPVARTGLVGAWPEPDGPPVGIVSGGASDAPVVGEAANTLRFLGMRSVTLQDVGVAGVHRLLQGLPELEGCACVICVAGFEGALASVLAGLVPQPVIGVPTSVGYGVATGGRAALHSMLASCAGGLTVVNVDNGCGAALAAARIVGTRTT